MALLNLSPVPRSTLTPSYLSDLLKQGLSLHSTLPSHTPLPIPLPDKPTWKPAQSSLFVSLFKSHFLSEPWFARVAISSEISYENAKYVLWDRKCEEEVRAIHEAGDIVELDGEDEVLEEEGGIVLQKVKKVLHIVGFAPREFLQWLIAKETVKGREMVIVAVPREGTVGEGNVRARYASAEVVRVLESGEVEVAGSSTSDAGGNLPRWVQNMAAAKRVLQDGEALLRAIQERGK